MKGDRRADVPGEGEDGIARPEMGGCRALQDEVFLAVGYCPDIGNCLEIDPLVNGVFSGNGLVPEIQADVHVAGFTDDPGQEAGGNFKIQFSKRACVTYVPKQGGAGTALPAC